MKTILAHLHAAEGYAALSHSKRAKVGAVIVKDNRVVSIGYNGTPNGWDNCCENPDGSTKKEVIHAEANAIMFAAKNGMATNGCAMIVTMSPCTECAKLIAQSGITAVYYKDEYRDLDGINFLTECMVDICQIK